MKLPGVNEVKITKLRAPSLSREKRIENRSKAGGDTSFETLWTEAVRAGSEVGLRGGLLRSEMLDRCEPCPPHQRFELGGMEKRQPWLTTPCSKPHCGRRKGTVDVVAPLVRHDIGHHD